MVGILRRDLSLQADDALKSAKKEIYTHIEQKLKAINDLPNKRDYIGKTEFNLFCRDFRAVEANVDRV